MDRRLLPDTLFGRLFVATVGVIGAMLLVFILLIVRERRELALLDSGAGSSANTIAETSQYLAGLSREQRDDARLKLREQRLTPDDVRPPPPRIQDEERAALERAFAAHLQRHLGSEYKVATGPPRARRSEVIPLHVLRRDLPPPDGAPPPGLIRRDRVFDVTVTFPDGDKAVFRTFAPRSGPRLPKQIFLELGLLAIALGVVLYAMTRTITRPLGDLARAADAVGRGATGTPLKETGGREIRRATRAFNSMQERLRRYLDSRTQVLAAMSHDLRTPLTRLRLRVESVDDDQLRQRLVEDLDEMSSMIRGALGVFRGLNDDETAVPVDINALALELQRQHAEMGGEVSISGSARAPYVAKPLALKRCLGNLVQNAIRHGVSATIQIDDGLQLIVRVLDEGPGIPEDMLEKVFEPFFRLEHSRNRDTGGTGLGLSIARDIAQAHGGSLSLHNRQNGGLEARLVLPREATSH
ncbi:ATP-binding protein [Peristeroidobacter agariperforans]|uniref:ATP-binding protein n=1 Tax=Peristeroidobacter agariperforans TaxID=268404 RepID=UPI00101D64F4|nr:ATP-binding protein [Peristeroidobacter agariperforans]